MIGLAQEQWLSTGGALAGALERHRPGRADGAIARDDREGTKGFWTDNWNGYPASRARLLQHIHDSKVANPVVIGGDIHSFWNNDLKLDFDDPASPTVATELVGTSITLAGVPYELFASFLPRTRMSASSRAASAAMSWSSSPAPARPHQALRPCRPRS